MVAVDGSICSDWAFHSAVHGLNPAEDVLTIISVAHVNAMNNIAATIVEASLGEGRFPSEFLVRTPAISSLIHENCSWASLKRRT
jgi:hypothetical protein